MITVTESAVRQIRRVMEREVASGGEQKRSLRLGVRGGGCSGLSYFMELVEGAREDDLKFEFNGLEVFVDPKSHDFLQGTELDFVEGIRDHGFQWRNPNEKSNCGCGASFNV